MTRRDVQNAGQSSRQEYEARRHSWQLTGAPAVRNQRRIHAAVTAAAALALAAAAYFASPWLSSSLLVISALVALRAAAQALLPPALPEEVQELREQAHAEVTVAGALSRLPDAGYHVMYDRVTSAGALGAFVVGPTGLYALTVVPVPRKGLQITPAGVYAGARPLRGLADSALAIAQATVDDLTAALPDLGLEVRPVLVVDTSNDIAGLDELLGVSVITTEQISAWIRHGAPRHLNDAHALLIAQTATQSFSPAQALTDTNDWITTA